MSDVVDDGARWQAPDAHAGGVTRAQGAAAWLWTLGALAIIVSAWVVRHSISFGSALPPSMDAAYYPAQARWLVEHGRLLYQDLPLIFVIDALLAQVLALFGVAKDSAYLLASQWVDVIAQPLVCVSLFAMVQRWTSGRAIGLVAALGACVLATLCLPIVRMTCDFQKNSLALVFLAGSAWAFAGALREPMSGGLVGAIKRFKWLGLMLGLAAITHVGGFGATALMIASASLAYALIARSELFTLKPCALAAIAGLMVAGVTLGAVYLASPTRAKALLEAPSRLFAQRQGPQMPGDDRRAGPGMMDGPRMGGPDRAMNRGPGNGSMMRGPGGPRGPGGIMNIESRSWMVLYAINALGLIEIWRRRRETLAGDRAVVFGAALCSTLLVLPILNPEYASRLALMAPVPSAIVLAFVLSGWITSRQIFGAALASLLSVAVAAVSIYSTSAGWQMTKHAVVREEAIGEFKEIAASIENPSRTLIVARHGLEWWAAYFLHTPVREGKVPDGAHDKYERVMILEQIGGMGGPPGMMGGPGGGGRGMGEDFGPPPGMRRDDDRDSDFRGPPPGMGPMGGPPGMRGPGGGMGGPMQSPRVPSDAKLIFEGDFYRLWEVPGPREK